MSPVPVHVPASIQTHPVSPRSTLTQLQNPDLGPCTLPPASSPTTAPDKYRPLDIFHLQHLPPPPSMLVHGFAVTPQELPRHFKVDPPHLMLHLGPHAQLPLPILLRAATVTCFNSHCRSKVCEHDHIDKLKKTT